MMNIYASDDHILAITDTIEAELHSHLFIQVSVSLDSDFRINISGDSFSCRGIMIDSNIKHCFDGNRNKQLFLLIDNTSELAKQLRNTFLLNETQLLDYKNPALQKLISDKKWNALNANDKILHIYNYVRDSIAFGYNKADDIPASQILKDGYGQCNTKGILFMALLRSVGIPCRVHGFTIDKKLQKGAITGLSYQLSPAELLHSWVEIYYDEKWYNLEGFILDVPYLTKIQKKFSECNGSFCGYGVATKHLNNPPIYWNQNDTYIQKEGIVRDFGVYDSPDKLFAEHKQSLGVLTNIFYQYLARHLMNSKIGRIRGMQLWYAKRK